MKTVWVFNVFYNTEKKMHTNYLALERYGHCLLITLWNRIFGVG
jgi:hypothetical protein